MSKFTEQQQKSLNQWITTYTPYWGAQFYVDYYKIIFKCVDDQQNLFFRYDKITGLWKQISNQRLSFFLACDLRLLLTDLSDEFYKKKDESYKKIDGLLKKINKRHCDEIVDQIKQFENIYDPEFFNCLDDIRRTVINFKNGYIDLKTKQFHKRKITDYFSKCLEYDYIENEEERNKKLDEPKKYLKNILKQICNNNNEDYAYILRLLGYSITPSCSDESMYYFYGPTASNGKSTLSEIMKTAFSIYADEINNKAFESNAEKAHKYLLKMNKSRLGVIEETRDGAMLDSSVIKKIADGQKLVLEVLYSTDVSIKCSFKLFFNSNHPPAFDFSNDKGIDRRVKLTIFQSQFTDDKKKVNEKNNIFLKDPFLKDNIKEDIYKQAIAELIIEQAYLYYKFGLKKQRDYHHEQLKVIIDSNDYFTKFFHKFYIITNNNKDRVDPDDFLALYKIETQQMKTSKKYCITRLQKMGINTNISHKKNGESYINGIKLIENEQLNNDENDKDDKDDYMFIDDNTTNNTLQESLKNTKKQTVKEFCVFQTKNEIKEQTKNLKNNDLLIDLLNVEDNPTLKELDKKEYKKKSKKNTTSIINVSKDDDIDDVFDI